MILDCGDVVWILVLFFRYFFYRNVVEINFIMDVKKNWLEDFYFENNRFVEYVVKVIVLIF